jgi:hypothetical protein
VPGDLDDVVHLIAVQPRGVGGEDEIALPDLQPVEREQFPALGRAVLFGGVELEHVGADRGHSGVALVPQRHGAAQFGGVVAEVPDRWSLREELTELRQVGADGPSLPAADRGQLRPREPGPQLAVGAGGRPLQPPGPLGVGAQAQRRPQVRGHGDVGGQRPVADVADDGLGVAGQPVSQQDDGARVDRGDEADVLAGGQPQQRVVLGLIVLDGEHPIGCGVHRPDGPGHGAVGVPGLGAAGDTAWGVALDLGTDDAEDPPPDDPRMVAVQAAQPQPGEMRLGPLAFPGHRDVLARPGGPAGGGEQHRWVLGQLVGLPRHLGLDVGLQGLVAGDGHPLLELRQRDDAGEAVAAAELGAGVAAQDLAEQAVLRPGGSAAERVEMPQRPRGLGPQQQPSYSRHRSPLSRAMRHGSGRPPTAAASPDRPGPPARPRPEVAAAGRRSGTGAAARPGPLAAGAGRSSLPHSAPPG